MHTAPGLNKILSQVKKLNKLDQTALLKKITAMVQGEGHAGKAVKLSEISGLGASVWRDVNIDQYVDSERQW
jgi:hypothetical protein